MARMNVTATEHDRMLRLIDDCQSQKEYFCEMSWHQGLEQIFGVPTVSQMKAVKNVQVVVHNHVPAIPYIGPGLKLRRLEAK